MLSWRELDQYQFNDETDFGFEAEYLWEISYSASGCAERSSDFDQAKFCKGRGGVCLENIRWRLDINGKSSLKALRDMIEHFDDYAAGGGAGAGTG